MRLYFNAIGFLKEMKTKIIFIILVIITKNLFAQYPLAPEVWSVPEKIGVISEWATSSRSPSISFNKQKLYFEGLAVTEWVDTGWNVPNSLPNYINQHLACSPCISPNGKRLFFTWFWPTWNIYYSDWDSTINNWGPAINCGTNVNNPYADGCVLPNDTTLIFLKDTETHISYWNKQTQTWGPSERWPTSTLWFQSDWGVYVSPNFGKVYLEGARVDTTIGGQYYLNYDIVVCYRDTLNPMGYKPPKILNYCLYSDTQYFAGNYVSRFEGFPTLTPDGKKMYFTADYDSQTTIYESTMLIDENGNPVNVERGKEGLPLKKMELLPAYPNPFNPRTKIKYNINKTTDVRISVYDMLGQRIADLLNSEKSEGEYEIIIDAEELKLTSGTYIVSLRTKEQQLAQKIIYIK